MFDEKGRLWLSATVRGMDNPAFCKQGSDHPSAKAFPLEKSARQVAMLDPKTMKYSFINTCFGTHHPQFGYDANDTLWLSGTGPVAGWVNTKMFDETGDAAKVARLVAVRARHQRQRQARRLCRAQRPARSGQGQADRPGFGALRRDAVTGRRLDLVHGRRVRRTASVPAIRPGYRTVGSVQCSCAGVRNPRRRHRQERRCLGVVIERSPRQLRPPQVQGPAQRAGCHRQSLPRGLDASISIPVPASTVSARTAQNRAITLGSTSTTRPDLARTYQCPPPISVTASWR